MPVSTEPLPVLLQKRDAAIEKARSITGPAGEERTLTDEQSVEVDALLNEAEQLDAAIAERRLANQRDRLAEASARAAAPLPRQSTPMLNHDGPGGASGGGASGGAASAHPMISMEDFQERVLARRASGMLVFRGTRDGLPAEERARLFAHTVLAAANKDASLSRSAAYLRAHAERRAQLQQRAGSPAMGGGIEADGGFLVPTETVSDLILLLAEAGIVRRLCRVWPMRRDQVKGPKITKLPEVFAVNENTDKPISKPEGMWVVLDAKKWACIVLVSEELDEDSLPYVGDVLAELFVQVFALNEDKIILLGNGTPAHNGVEGIVTETGAAGVTTGPAALVDLTIADFASMIGLVQSYAMGPGFAWVMNPTAWAIAAAAIYPGLGGATPADVIRGFPPAILGYPVVTTPALPASPVAGDPVVVAGNFARGCLFGDRRRLTIARSEHVYFVADQIAVRGVQRFDFQVHDPATATALGSFAVMELGATTP